MKQRILVSACLLGTPCRYDGKSKPNKAVQALAQTYEIIPVCPECLGGLKIPHLPSEQRNGRVYSSDGRDVTAAFQLGAQKTLAIAQNNTVAFAILKARSPSCGKDTVYDGTFTGTLIKGQGLAARELTQAKIPIYTEEELDALPQNGEAAKS